MILNLRAVTNNVGEICDFDDFINIKGTLEYVIERVMNSFMKWRYVDDEITLIVVTDGDIEFEKLNIDSKKMTDGKWNYFWKVYDTELNTYLIENGYCKLLDNMVSKITKIKNEEINKAEEERRNNRYKQYLKLKEEFE